MTLVVQGGLHAGDVDLGEVKGRIAHGAFVKTTESWGGGVVGMAYCVLRVLWHAYAIRSTNDFISSRPGSFGETLQVLL